MCPTQAEVDVSKSPERGHKSAGRRGNPRWKKVVCVCPKERTASRKLVNAESKGSGLVDHLEFIEADPNDHVAVAKVRSPSFASGN